MDVGFSDRLSNIFILAKALASASGQELVDAQSEATALEESAYNRSKSKDEYEQHFNGLLRTLQTGDTTPDHASPSDAISALDPNGPDIGSYIHATPYKDGLFSNVFKAKPKIFGDQLNSEANVIALKVTTPSAMTAPHDSMKEARILRKVQHERIIPLLDSFWQPGGQFVLVFPFMTHDLETLLRSGDLQPPEGSRIIRALFEALAFLHSVDIIHRDVKPANILLREWDQSICLADFGIAWSPDDEGSEPAASKITDVGTTSYRPPELLFGHSAYDTSLDIWAAGCVVAEIMKRDHRPIFDSGPLGSELGLIKSIFSTLGTPHNESWPSARSYPDWGKMRFHEYVGKPWGEILPGVCPDGVDLVRQTVEYESTARLTARQALAHSGSGMQQIMAPIE